MPEAITPTKTIQTSTSRPTYTQQDKDEFAFWFSLPLTEREAAGAKDLSAYALTHDIARNTLYVWRQEPQFMKLVDNLRVKWGQNMTAAVMDGWKLACMKGSPQAIELWLAYFHGFIKKTEVDVHQQNEVGINDIRYIIDQLPEPLRSKHYGNLRELLDDANAYNSARSATDSGSEQGLAEVIPREADNNAQDVPSQRANELAARDTASVRPAMERKVHPRNNQGASWRGEE